MMQAINTFIGGINSDTDTSMLDGTTYRHAVNFRITDAVKSNSSGNMGALTTIGEHTVVSNVEQLNGQVCAVASVRGSRKYNSSYPAGNSTLLFMRTLSTSPGDVVNYIVEIKFPSKYQILPPMSYSIIYTDVDSPADDKLNFNTAMSVVTRYENEEVRKVYWATGDTPVRSMNLEEDNIGKLPSDFNIVPGVRLGAIYARTLNEGGNLKAGRIQYFYSVQKKYSGESGFSNASTMISLSTDYSNGSTEPYPEGSDIDENTGKAVEVEITNIPSGYTFIKVYSVFYNSYGTVPEIKLIAEQEISGNTLKIYDTGNYITHITLEELNSFGPALFKAKYLESKDNILFAANTEDSNFDVEFDARAYRFNKSSGTARIYASEDADTSSYIEITSAGNWAEYNSAGNQTGNAGSNWSIPENHNCINYYNRTYSDSNFNYSRQYKYLPNATTLGGKGKHVSYTFSPATRLLAETQESIPESAGEAAEINLNTSGNTVLLRSKEPSYKKGEVYRFGLVFYNKERKPSPVKWIGDIKIPERLDSSYRSHYRVTTTGTVRRIYGIYTRVNFVIDLSGISASLKNEMYAVQIVQVPRTNQDKSILASGLMSGLEKTNHDNQPLGTTDAPRPLRTGNTVVDDTKAGFIISPELTFGKLDLGNYTNLSMRFSNRIIDTNYSTDNPMVSNGIFRYYSIKGAEETAPVTASYPFADVYSLVTLGVIGVNTYTLGETLFDYTPYEIKISDTFTANYPVERHRGRTQVGSAQDGFFFTNRAITSYRYYPPFPLSVGLTDPKRAFYSGTCAPYLLESPTELTEGHGTIFLGDIVRDVFVSQYGGITHQSRQFNKYVAASHTNSIYPTSDTVAIMAFRGDTHIGMYQHMTCMWDGVSAGGGDASADSYKYTRQAMVIFPVESSINLDFKSTNTLKHMYNPDLYVHRNYDGTNRAGIQELASVGVSKWPTNYPDDLKDLYKYNLVYSQEPAYPEFRPSVATETLVSKNDTKVYSSERKFNGEFSDNWSNFKAANFIEVESGHGALTGIKNVGGKLLFWQDRAFGALSVNERSLVTDNNIGQLVLGTGGVLDRYDYISTDVGVHEHVSIVSDKNTVYWYDATNKNVIQFTGNLRFLDIEKNARKYIEKYLGESYIVKLFKNPKTEEILLVPYKNEYEPEDYVLVWNQLTDSFEGIHKYSTDYVFEDISTGNLYHIGSVFTMNGRDPDIRSTLYNFEKEENHSFLDDNSLPEVEFEVNDNHQVVKVFDNLNLPSKSDGVFDNGGTFDLTLSTSDQTTGTVRTFPIQGFKNSRNITTDEIYTIATNREKEWKIVIPRAFEGSEYSNKQRLRDRSLKVNMKVIRDSEGELKPFKIPYVKTIYRPSVR